MHKQQEKEALASKNEQLETVKAAAQKDPYVMNTLKGIEGYIKAIEAIESKGLVHDEGFVPYMDSQDKVDLTIAKEKLAMRRKDLATYFKGTISEEVINSITSYSNISRDIKSNVRQSKGIDKQIAHYEGALEKIGFISPREPISDELEPHASFSTSQILSGIPIERGEGESLGASRESGNNDSRWITEDENDGKNLPDVQPKWYQFVKRFKNWVNKRKADREFKEPEFFSREESSPKSAESNFKDAMKYDIIKDYEAKLEQDLLKSAKAERKGKEEEER